MTTVIDVGSGYPMWKLKGHLLELVNSASLYCAVEYTPEFHPTIIGDAYNLPIKDSVADIVICQAVLEHVTHPQNIVDEMYRILNFGGRLYIYVPFIYSYHAKPNKYEDYWRFTNSGLKYLLRHFSKIRIEPVGGIMTAFLLMTRFRRFKKLTMFFDKMIKTGVTQGWDGEAVK